MRGIGGSTLRGGQTVFHAIRMWGQLFRAAVLFAAFTTVVVPGWTLWHRTTGAEWYAAGMVTLAEVKLTIGYDPDSGQEIRFEDGTRRVLRIRDIAASLPAREARERIRDEMFQSAGLGAMSGGGLIGLFLVAFWLRGAQLGRQRRIRGAEMVTAAELRRRLQPPGLRVLALPARRRPVPALLDRGHTVSRAHRDPAHHRLGDHRLRQDGADLRSRLADPRPRRALRPLRQDGELHPVLLRCGPRRADEPARCPRAALVALPGSQEPARLRHDGRRADPAAEGHRRSVLGDRRAPALLQRRRGAAAEGDEGEQGPGRPSPEDRPDGARGGDGRHGRAVDRRSRQPQDRALGARHADRQPVGARVPARRGHAVLDPGVDLRRGPGRRPRRVPVPHVKGRPARQPPRPDLDLAGDRGQRHAVARPGRRQAHLGDPRRAADAAPGAVAPAGPRRIPPVRRLLRARRPGGVGTARPLRAQRGGDHLRALRHPRGAGRARPRHRAVVGRQPRPQRGRGGRRGLLLRRQHHPRRSLADAAPRAARAGASLRDHAAGEPLGLSQVPRPLPGRLHPPQIRLPAEGGERFVPREGDRTETGSPVGEPGNPPEAPPAAPAGDDGIAIPDLPGEAGAGPGEPPPAPEDAPEPAPLQGAFDLVPLPGEAGGAPKENGEAPKPGAAAAPAPAASEPGPEAAGAPPTDPEPGEAPAPADAGPKRGWF